MDVWQIAVSVAASALVSLGTALGARPRPEPSARDTMLPAAPLQPGVSLSSAETEALRGRVTALELRAGPQEERVAALEARERERDEAAAEFRGEMRARLARLFERLRIKWEERHGGDRGSDG